MPNILSFIRPNKPKRFEALLAPHLDALYKVAYQYLGNESDAEDLLQDLLLYLYANQEKMDGIEHLKPWLMRCLYNKFVDYYRKHKPMANTENLDNPDLHQQEEYSTVLSYAPDFHKGALQKQLEKSLEKLSVHQRAIVCLHDIEGHTLREVAEIVDRPIGTIKSDLHRARAKLKKHQSLATFKNDIAFI